MPQLDGMMSSKWKFVLWALFILEETHGSSRNFERGEVNRVKSLSGLLEGVCRRMSLLDTGSLPLPTELPYCTSVFLHSCTKDNSTEPWLSFAFKINFLNGESINKLSWTQKSIPNNKFITGWGVMRKIWSIITPLQSNSIMACLLTHLVLPVNAFCKTKFCVGSTRLLNTYVFNSLNNSSENTEHWHSVSMGEVHILLCIKISIYDHPARLHSVRFVSCLAQYSKWDLSGIRVKFIDADEFLYCIWIFV